MAKNNKLINSLLQIASRNREENVKAAADEMAPEAYAAFALVLYTRGWRHKRIENYSWKPRRSGTTTAREKKSAAW